MAILSTDATIYALRLNNYSTSSPFDLNDGGTVNIARYSNIVNTSYVPNTVFDFIDTLPILSIPGISGDLTAILDNVVGGFVGNYDSRILNFITAKTQSALKNASQILNKVAFRYSNGTNKHIVKPVSYQSGAFSISELCFNIDNGLFLATKNCADQTNGTARYGSTCFIQQQATPIPVKVNQISQTATILNNYLHSIMEQMTKVYPYKWRISIQDSGKARHHYLKELFYDSSPYVPIVGANITVTMNDNTGDLSIYDFLIPSIGYFSFGDAIGITSGKSTSSFTRATPKKIKRCVPVDMARKPPRGQSPWIDLPRPEPPTNPPSGNTLTIPIKEVYTMKNTISVTLNDLTAIEMDDLSLAFDVDSFAWQFSGQLLDPAQLSLVKPLANGDAVVLIVTINNVVWHVMAEKISHNRQFGQRSITISGRGLSALLAAPYRVAGSGTQGSLLTNQQLADSHVPFGWTLNWQATTWNVTGGAYSWQNRTELEAIADIAAWCGAMLIPARDSQTLTVKPRYPVLPWNFAATAVDVAIPEAVITDMTYREASQKHPNGVYVHGGEIGGQLAFCRLNGTAGDILVETTSNPLMTDPTGLRALGERLLSGQYIQPDIEQITTFMDGSTVPFIDVGTLVGVTVDSVETKAIVNSVSVNANQGEVYQTLTLGEQSSNQWIAFRSLLPKDPLLVGTITSTTGTSSIIQLIDGGVLNVRGTGAVNSQVYIRSGQIQGEAPNMVQTTIVI